MQHRGKAVVFADADDFKARIDDPDLDVDANSILVLQNAGPVGYPGMPEVGNLALPKKLLEQGVTDLVRISDGRMSGTAYGTVVLHVAPGIGDWRPAGVGRDRRLHHPRRRRAPTDARSQRRGTGAPARPVDRPPAALCARLRQDLHRPRAAGRQGVDFDVLVGSSGTPFPKFLSDARHTCQNVLRFPRHQNAPLAGRLGAAVFRGALGCARCGRLHRPGHVAGIRPLDDELASSAAAPAPASMSKSSHVEPGTNPYELEIAIVDDLKPGDVAVFACGGSYKIAPWGSLLSTATRARGAAGCVTDGFVRDILEIRAMRLPVFHGGIAPLDSKGRGHIVAVDVPVVCDGVTVAPGDLVFGDADGVVVVPQAIEAKVLRDRLRQDQRRAPFDARTARGRVICATSTPNTGCCDGGVRRHAHAETVDSKAARLRPICRSAVRRSRACPSPSSSPLLVILFCIAAPRAFLGYRLYMSFMASVPPPMIIALGLTLIAVAGEMDLSFPSVVAFSSYVFSALYQNYGLTWPALGAALATGTLLGLANGLIITQLGIPSLIATLATLFLWGGLATVISNGVSVAIPQIIGTDDPDRLRRPHRGISRCR